MEYDRKAEPYTLHLSPEEVARLEKEKQELLKNVTPNPNRVVRQTKVMVKL